MADFTPENFNKEIESLMQNIADGIPDIVQTIALDAKQKIQSRIQEKGLSSEEVSFPGYTDKYAKRREKKGRQVGFVDMTVTGGMFRRMQIIETGQKGDEYVVAVGGADDETQDKIDGNSFGNDKWSGRGDIMAVSENEEAELTENWDKAIQEIIDNSGFGQ